ncbi:MAG: TIR domain-containing protein [Clostridia bacterium]|nr:TIR domain-containing protein [Clostridia bacterium]
MNKITDVFFSYNKDVSAELVEKIATGIESQGMRCWYFHRDGKGAYAKEIMDAIKQCRAFILIANDKSLRSEDCLNEIELGFERLRREKKEGRDDFGIYSFKTQDIDLMDYDAAYYVKRFTWIDATVPPIEDHIASLISDVCSRISEVKITLSVNREQKLKSCFQYPKKTFIGRKKELEDINNFFDNGSHCVVLHGMGGIGKSELAKYYAVNNKDKYSTVIFAPFKGSIEQTVLEDTVFNITGFKMSPDEKSSDYFMRKLKEIIRVSDENTLIVLDGFDTASDKDFKMFLSGNYKVLITTRNKELSEFFDVIDVVGFDERSAFDLFEKYYGKAVKESSKETLGKIFEILQYHTLAIEICAKQMKTSRIDAGSMLDAMTRSGFYYDISERITDIGGKEGSEASVIIERLFDIAGLSESRCIILGNLSLMPKSGIFINIFKEICGLDSYEEINHLISQSWIKLDEDLDKVSLHPLIFDVVKHKLKPCWKNNYQLIYYLDKYLKCHKKDEFDDEVETIVDVIGLIITEEKSLTNNFSDESFSIIEKYYNLNIDKLKEEGRSLIEERRSLIEELITLLKKLKQSLKEQKGLYLEHRNLLHEIEASLNEGYELTEEDNKMLEDKKKTLDDHRNELLRSYEELIESIDFLFGYEDSLTEEEKEKFAKEKANLSEEYKKLSEESE